MAPVEGRAEGPVARVQLFGSHRRQLSVGPVLGDQAGPEVDTAFMTDRLASLVLRDLGREKADDHVPVVQRWISSPVRPSARSSANSVAICMMRPAPVSTTSGSLRVATARGAILALSNADSPASEGTPSIAPPRIARRALSSFSSGGPGNGGPGWTPRPSCRQLQTRAAPPQRAGQEDGQGKKNGQARTGKVTHFEVRVS